MEAIQINRWLRAIEIAKIVFEDEGYHTAYLNQIDQFIRRKTMYSPKIKEEFIPALYRMAKAKRITMTKLVNQIISGYLEKDVKQEGREITHDTERKLGGLQRAETESGLPGDLGALRPFVLHEAEGR